MLMPDGLILAISAFFIGVAFMSVVEVFEARYGKRTERPDAVEVFFFTVIYTLCGLACAILFIYTFKTLEL